jgi:hypothetical protein
MSDSVDFRVVVIAAAAIFVLGVFVLDSGQSPSPGDYGPAKPAIAATAPAPEPSSENGERPADSAPAYVPRMPGVSVVLSNGKYSLNAVHVAIPGSFNEVEHLSGTDPKAVQYLEDREAAHAQLALDNGPLNVDTSSLPPPGTFSNQVKRVGVMVKSQ